MQKEWDQLNSEEKIHVIDTLDMPDWLVEDYAKI
jgi:hypothetical protein